MILKKGVRCAIVLGDAPTPRERFAADELTKYLKLCLDAKTVSFEECEAKFIIGGPYSNAAAEKLISRDEFSSLLTGEEGMLIRISERSVLIAGSFGYDDRERGTVYAVYEFLERYLGCCFAAYSKPDCDAGEIIPSLDEIELADGQYVKPSSELLYRCAIVQYGNKAGDPDHGLNIPFIDWLAKNRYNRILTWCSIYEGYKRMGITEELEKRGIRLSVGHHDSIGLWLPFFKNEYFDECYAESHPEYYRLNSDGTRFRPKAPDDPYGQWVVCSRNEECIEAISRNLIKWISENPIVDIIALWPMDGTFEQCCCEMCAPYTKIENYSYFLNEVAKRVSTAHPRIKIDMLLYTDLWECPKECELSPALFCDMSTWAAKGLRACGKPDGSCLVNSMFTDTLEVWHRRGAKVTFYDYYMGVYPARQRMIPMSDELQSIWKYFASHGIEGSGTQVECYNIWNHLFNVCGFARTAYDTNYSFEDNLEFVSRLFGEGAEYIKSAVRMMEQVNDGQETINNVGFYLMENIDKEYIYGCFEKALEAALSPRERNNIRLFRMAFRYTDLETADPGCRQKFAWVLPYEDTTGELAHMAVKFDSFYHSKLGYGIAFPLSNTDTKGFVPDKWYDFE